MRVSFNLYPLQLQTQRTETTAPRFGLSLPVESWPNALRKSFRDDAAAQQDWERSLRSWSRDRDASWRQMAVDSMKAVIRPSDIGTTPGKLWSTGTVDKMLSPLLGDKDRRVRASAEQLATLYAPVKRQDADAKRPVLFLSA